MSKKKGRKAAKQQAAAAQGGTGGGAGGPVSMDEMRARYDRVRPLSDGQVGYSRINHIQALVDGWMTHVDAGLCTVSTIHERFTYVSASTVLRNRKLAAFECLQDLARKMQLSSRILDKWPIGMRKNLTEAECLAVLARLKLLLLPEPVKADVLEDIARDLAPNLAAAAQAEAQAPPPAAPQRVVFNGSEDPEVVVGYYVKDLYDSHTAQYKRQLENELIPLVGTLFEGEQWVIPPLQWLLPGGNSYRTLTLECPKRKVVGWARGERLKGTNVLHIRCHGVADGHRGKGLAKLLVFELLRTFPDEDAITADMEADNKASIACLRGAAGLLGRGWERIGRVDAAGHFHANEAPHSDQELGRYSMAKTQAAIDAAQAAAAAAAAAAANAVRKNRKTRSGGEF